jgi:hypothetical protein
VWGGYGVGALVVQRVVWALSARGMRASATRAQPDRRLGQFERLITRPRLSKCRTQPSATATPEGEMCNDFGNRVPYDEYLRAFSEIRIPLRFASAAPNLFKAEDAR